jgi:thiol-disulfide isomerase/thioredoxin
MNSFCPPPLFFSDTRSSQISRLTTSTSPATFNPSIRSKRPTRAIIAPASQSPVRALPCAADLRALLCAEPAAEAPSVVVVKLFAKYCRACLGVAPRYAKSARAFGHEGADVEFAEMDFAANEEFCRETLGCETLPFFALFKREPGSDGAVLVEGLTLPWNRLAVLDKKVEELLSSEPATVETIDPAVSTDAECEVSDVAINI